jgi:hypothetical protein
MTDRYHRDPAGVVWDTVTGLPTNCGEEAKKKTIRNREAAARQRAGCRV